MFDIIQPVINGLLNFTIIQRNKMCVGKDADDVCGCAMSSCRMDDITVGRLNPRRSYIDFVTVVAALGF